MEFFACFFEKSTHIFNCKHSHMPALEQAYADWNFQEQRHHYLRMHSWKKS